MNNAQNTTNAATAATVTRYYAFTESFSEGYPTLSIAGCSLIACANRKNGKGTWNVISAKTGLLMTQTKAAEVRRVLIGEARSLNIAPTEVL